MSFPGGAFILAVFIIFCVSAAIQLFYYAWFYLATSAARKKNEGGFKGPVSVIICARNEAENLRNHLPAVLEQDWPDFEVIVVNDCSEDSSDDVLGEFLVKYPNLKLSTIHKDPKFTHNKKFAQFIGIKAASHEVLLFTDADCLPASPGWIAEMAGKFNDSTDFVLGYGGYRRAPGLLNMYIRYDCLFIAMQYLGMAIRGIPYMGVGRNLAYRKSVFFRNRGFGTHSHVISGDDDLFVNGNASGERTAVCYTHNSHTYSVPASTAGEWVKQKQRHLTTASLYRLRDKILLSAEPASRLLYYTTLIILLTRLHMWQYVAAIAGARTVILLTSVFLASKRLNERGITVISLIFDIFSPIINSFLYLSTLRNRKAATVWK